MTQQFKPVPKDYEKRMPNDLKKIMEFPGFTADNMSQFKEKCAASSGERSNMRYGWVKTSVFPQDIQGNCLERFIFITARFRTPRFIAHSYAGSASLIGNASMSDELPFSAQ